MVHHADLDFDVTTGVRFRVLEILLSMGIKMAAVVLLGAPAVGVLTQLPQLRYRNTKKRRVFESLVPQVGAPRSSALQAGAA